MDPSEMRYFQKAGIVHVLSVSGMHVALIFSILFWPLKWIRWPWLHRIAWMIIMFVIWLYGSMTGMSPPVERAVWAITYSQIGQQIFNRKIWIADSYFFVGSLQLMVDPLMIFDVGFQLSYAAMAGIALVVPNFNEWQLQKEWPSWKSNLVSGIVVSFVCSLTTLPVVLYYFHQFSNWFVLGNLLLIPLFTVLIYAYLGLMVLAFMGVFTFFEELQYVCLYLFDLFLLLIHNILAFIDNLPFGFSYAPDFTGMHAIVLSSMVVFWIHRIHFPHERKWTNWAVFSFLILVSL
jgi:competence protein ComEC